MIPGRPLDGRSPNNVRWVLTDVQRQLRATSDSLLQDLEVLLALEQEKRDLPVDDERVVELAARIDEIAGRVAERTHEQQELAIPLKAAAEAGLAAATPIEEAPPRATAVILAEWRAAERAAQDSDAGSPERIEAEARAALLRTEYGRAYDAIRATDGEADREA